MLDYVLRFRGRPFRRAATQSSPNRCTTSQKSEETTTGFQYTAAATRFETLKGRKA